MPRTPVHAAASSVLLASLFIFDDFIQRFSEIPHPTLGYGEVVARHNFLQFVLPAAGSALYQLVTSDFAGDLLLLHLLNFSKLDFL